MSQENDIDYWQRIIKMYEESGLTVREFAAKRGLPLGKLLYWLFRLGGEADKTASDRSGKAFEASNELPSDLIVVWLVPKSVALVIDQTVGQGVLCKLLEAQC